MMKGGADSDTAEELAQVLHDLGIDLGVQTVRSEVQPHPVTLHARCEAS